MLSQACVCSPGVVVVGMGGFRHITCILSCMIGRVPPGIPSPLLVTSGGDAHPLLDDM